MLKKPKLTKELKFVESELKLFFYWIEERHQIFLNRKAGKKWPWTADKILQTFKFTNPYRQNDAVTQDWTNRYAHLLGLRPKMKEEDIFFWLCVFRFFNWPATYATLYYKMNGKWNIGRAIKLLNEQKNVDHEQLYTGAYIITAGGSKGAKHVGTCAALNYVYQNRRKLVKKIMKGNSMEKATEIVMSLPTQGPFTAYEIVCDLRHTKILCNARDVLTWANAGPGAKRGIHRLLTGDKDWDGKKPDYNEVMRVLLMRARKQLKKHVFECDYPFEMREIEHSLCEYDKYRRVQLKQGRPRSLYHYKDPELLKQLREAEDEE